MLEPLPSDQYVHFGCWANLLVLRSVSAESKETFALYESNLRTVLRRHPRGAGAVLLVEHGEPPPEGYTERLQGFLATYRAQLLAACAVIHARGFAAAVQRAAGTAVLTVSGMRGRLAIHESTDAAVPWLAERLFHEGERAERARQLRTVLQHKV